MSQNPAEIPSGSNYRLIFDNALAAYEKKTGKDLPSDPVFHKLEFCNSPNEVLSVLQEQIPGFDQSGNQGNRFSNWLAPTVNVLYAFSATIGGAVGLVRLGDLIRTRLDLISPF
jgi:hypothetical protein